MKKISVVIADDHKMFREGISTLLNLSDDIEVIAEAENGAELLRIASTTTFDVAILDIDMGEMSGIEVAEKLSRSNPEIKILVLSMHSEITFVVKMLDAGASGYILKNAGKEEMITAIKAVANGDTYYSKQVSAKLIQQLSSKKKIKDIFHGKEVPLTERETEVLKLIAQEYSNPEIAEQLFISIRTVDSHRRNLIEKLGVKNTAGLVKYAIKMGLTD